MKILNVETESLVTDFILIFMKKVQTSLILFSSDGPNLKRKLVR